MRTSPVAREGRSADASADLLVRESRDLGCWNHLLRVLLTDHESGDLVDGIGETSFTLHLIDSGPSRLGYRGMLIRPGSASRFGWLVDLVVGQRFS